MWFEIRNRLVTNFGGLVFLFGFAAAAVPIAIAIWQHKRLGWIVFVPYEIVVIALMLVVGTNL